MMRLFLPRRSAATVVALLLAAAPAFAGSQSLAGTSFIDASDTPSLRTELLKLAQKQLEPAHLFVDPQRVWLTLSSPLPQAEGFEVRAQWSAQSGRPPLPLSFELRPLHQGVAGKPMQAYLAVQFLQDQWVATRRLRRGSVASCADLELQRRPAQPAATLTAADCEVARGVVVLRDVASGEVIRRTDLGIAPEVAAQSPVEVSVLVPGIRLTTTAIALADARLGDEIPVRLQHPARILKARVTGIGSAELVDASP
jgi:flagella basal body P-ring formation protein FlgA